MVFTGDENIATRARFASDPALPMWEADKGWPLPPFSGQCYRPSEIMGAIACVQLGKIHDILAHTRKLKRAFIEALDDLRARNREAMAARVIAELPNVTGQYWFSHALIRETLYDEVSTGRRLLLHRRLGGILEDLYAGDPEPHMAELARHFGEAAPGGDAEKAIDYARDRIEKARRPGSLAEWYAANSPRFNTPDYTRRLEHEAAVFLLPVFFPF